MAEPIQPDKQLTPQAERVLQYLVSTMAHEVRTPMTFIIGWSRVMLEDKIGSLNEEQRKGLTSIHESGKHVLEVFNEFLEINRLIFGSLHLHIEEVNLSQLIEKVVANAQAKVQQDIPNNLPDIWADRDHIQRALMWILREVLDAIHPPEEGTITLTVSSDDCWTTFNVTAIGKEKFYYYDDPDNPTLFFSRSIIEMHGGQLTVELQEEQKRLEISFTLPIERNQLPENNTVEIS